MEKSINNIDTNLECGYKFLNNAKDYRLQYIKHLPIPQFFVGVVNTWILKKFQIF